MGEGARGDAEPAAPRFTFSYRVVRFLCRLFLRTEFRRIEVSDADRVPAKGPLLLVANHFSSLIDPMALIPASPRPLSILARAPLFGWWPLSWILRAIGAVPVYRPQDVEENRGVTTTANVEMFKACWERLGQGGAIALFPEGLSQPGPKLLPLRTGAARIALDAGAPIDVQPAGLLYGPPEGGRRGTLLIRFGEPFSLNGHEEGAAGPEGVRLVTRRLEDAIREILVEAPSQTDLKLLRVLRTVWEQEEGVPAPASLAEAHDRDREFARGLARLQQTDPSVVEKLRRETDSYLQALRVSRLRPENMGVRYTAGRVLRFLALEVPAFLLGLPLGILAGVVTWPIRDLGDVIALRMAGGRQEMRALCRMFGGATMLLLAMLVGGLLASAAWGRWAALAVVLGLPLLLLYHVFWRDHQRSLRARLRAFLLLAGARLRKTLEAHRRRVYERFRAARASIT